MLEERTRLARDIHDTLAQGLTGIVVQLGAAQRALAVAPDESREHLALAQRMAHESLAERGVRCGICGRRRSIAATSRTPCGRWRSARWGAMWLSLSS